jgi:hypothetical protein
MSSFNIDELLEILPKLIRENDRVKGAIISALTGVIATKEDIRELIDLSNKRFEATEKRFETLQQEMDKRFEASEKRFEARQKEIDKRFEIIDKRFDAQDQKFDTVITKLDHLLTAFGAPFEQFARNVIERILSGEGIKNVKLKNNTFKDPKGEVFPDTFEIEVDGYSEEPPIIVEITTILQNKEKVALFLQKKAFIEKKQMKTFRGFFVAATSKLSQEEIGDVIVLLRSKNCELINL